MARAATTTDVFNAIAEPRRREIIGLVGALRLPQPAVSKHLGVLRKVGIVSVTSKGPLRLYRLNPQELKPVHDWVKEFERYWTHQIDRIKQRAESKMSPRSVSEAKSQQR